MDCRWGLSKAVKRRPPWRGMSPAFAGFSFYLFFFFLGDFHVCVPRGGGILSAERPSCGQKGVKEMSRLEFGTKLDTVPLNGLY